MQRGFGSENKFLLYRVVKFQFNLVKYPMVQHEGFQDEFIFKETL